MEKGGLDRLTVHCSWPWLMTAGHILSILAERKMSHFNSQRVAKLFLKGAILSWRRQTHVIDGFSSSWVACAYWASVETLRSPIIFPSPLRRNSKLNLRLYCPATGMRSRYFCMPRCLEHVNTSEFRQCRQRNPTSTQKRPVSTYQSDVARGYLYSCTSYILYLWSPAVKPNNRSRHDMNVQKKTKSANLTTLWFLCILCSYTKIFPRTLFGTYRNIYGIWCLLGRASLW